jgi:hypothetical protein
VGEQIGAADAVDLPRVGRADHPQQDANAQTCRTEDPLATEPAPFHVPPRIIV